MMAEISGPAYRIQTERFIIRCYRPRDVLMLKTAIDESLDHLRPWMPWAMDEPTDLEERIARLRRFRGEFDLGQDFIYGIFNLEETELLGGCGLHTRIGPTVREIGYWTRQSHINRGQATEISAALTRVAFEVEKMERVEIQCDPHNVRSAAVPRKLGFQHEATLRRRTLTSDGKSRDTMIWTLFADEYPSSPASRTKVNAYDAIWRKIL